MLTWLSGTLDATLKWFVSTTLWEMFARHWMGHFTFRVFGYTKFPMGKYFDVLDIISKEPNAMYGFVSADPSGLSFKVNHAFTKCKWGHAGIIKKEGDHLYAWHMKGDGLLHWHLLDVMRQCDNFALLRMPLEGANLDIANSRLNAIINAPLVAYNYSFQMPTDVINWLTKGQALTPEGATELQTLKLYCSEMNYVIGVGLVSNPKFVAKWEYGVPTFEPDDLYDASDVLFEHDEDVLT